MGLSGNAANKGTMGILDVAPVASMEAGSQSPEIMPEPGSWKV